MANKKAEILTMGGQVVSPITLATNVLLDDGRTAQDLLDSRDESMFSPTITTSSSMSKVGQGDSVDYSANVVNGAYESMVLKGKTLVNYNTEGNDRNEYVCMPSVEGNNLTVNDTVEGKVKSAILSGQTLVNLCVGHLSLTNNSNVFTTYSDGTYTYSAQEGYDGSIAPANMLKIKTPYKLKPNNTYTIIVTQLTGGESKFGVRYWDGNNNYDLAEDVAKTGVHRYSFRTSDNDGDSYLELRLRHYTSERSISFKDIILLEGDYTNVDIPHFEGMQSVKMPVLTTTGKNVWSETDVIQGFYNESDVFSDNKQFVTTRNPNKVLPNETYIYSNNLNTVYGIINFYDKDMNIISSIANKNKDYFTTPSNCRFVRICSFVVDGISPNDVEWIQLEKGTIATPYEPYKSNILTVNEEVELGSVGDVKDTLDLTTGELTQRVGSFTFDGTNTPPLMFLEPNRAEGYTVFPMNLKTVFPNAKDNLTNNLQQLSNNFSWIKDGYGGRKPGKWMSVNFMYFIFSIPNEELESLDVNGFNKWMSKNPTTVYCPINDVIKTVDLSDNVVYSYKDTTHYACSSEEGSLLPTLAIEEGVKYQAIIKPSTKYSVVFNRTEVASGLTVDLGGVTANIVSTTLGKTIVQITTPPTLSHNYVIFKGLGNVIKDVQVIEGDVVGDEPYFEGMCDVEMPVVKNVGKNLFDGKIEKSSIDVTTGSITPNVSSSWSATNYINVKNINSLYFQTSQLSNMNIVYMCFDENKNFIGYKGFYNSLTGIITPLNNTHYIRLRLPSDIDVSTTQIEQGSVATSYEPYKSNILSFDQKDGKTIVLRSRPNGVCDTLDLETGVYVQRIGEVVLDGSKDEGWKLINESQSVNSHFKCGNVVPGALLVTSSNSSVKVLCDDYNSYTQPQLCNKPNDYYGISLSWSEPMLCVRDTKFAFTNEGVAEFTAYLQQNPITVQYELATPIITTIDLKQHPFAYKDGYVVLTSSSEEVSLTPTIEYSLIANRLGQIQTNQKLVEKQQTQIDELESMVVANLVNTQYQQALNEIKLGVK